MPLRTGPLTKRATRDIQIPGDEGGFVESKTAICRTDMRKGAWGRQYGEMRLALMRAGNKGGALKTYCHYRRHLFKLQAHCDVQAGARTSIRNSELELELIQSHMAQKPVLRGEVGARALRVRSDVFGTPN